MLLEREAIASNSRSYDATKASMRSSSSSRVTWSMSIPNALTACSCAFDSGTASSRLRRHVTVLSEGGQGSFGHGVDGVGSNQLLHVHRVAALVWMHLRVQPVSPRVGGARCAQRPPGWQGRTSGSRTIWPVAARPGSAGYGSARQREEPELQCRQRVLASAESLPSSGASSRWPWSMNGTARSAAPAKSWVAAPQPALPQSITPTLFGTVQAPSVALAGDGRHPIFYAATVEGLRMRQ